MFSSMSSVNEFSLKYLTSKTATLNVIIGASRTQTLVNLDKLRYQNLVLIEGTHFLTLGKVVEVKFYSSALVGESMFIIQCLNT